MRPVFGSRPCKVCEGTGKTYGLACATCQGDGYIKPTTDEMVAEVVDRAERPRAYQDAETGTDTTSDPKSAQRPNLALPRDATAQPNAEACHRVHSNLDIAAYYLDRDGQVSAFDAVYVSRCPWCGFDRRNTRLAATIWRLRHDRGYDIETVEESNRLALYRLA